MDAIAALLRMPVAREAREEVINASNPWGDEHIKLTEIIKDPRLLEVLKR